MALKVKAVEKKIKFDKNPDNPDDDAGDTN